MGGSMVSSGIANGRKALAALVALLLWSSHGRAADGLDVREWLGRPGVRLVVVEFYATWCKPCMAAVPKWQALAEKHRNAGVRLIVVATRDPDSQCAAVGWTPDKQVCDLEGFVADQFGVGDKLPSAFLWSWDGRLLVKGGHVEQVEAAIEKYLAANPRVAVEVAAEKGKPPAGLEALIRSELSRSGKLSVVSRGAELEKLRELRKETHDVRKAEDQQCKLGEEMSPNSWLKATVFGEGAARRLGLVLLNLETGCQTALTTVRLDARALERSVGEAVGGILAQLSSEVVSPTAATVRKAARSEPVAGAQAAGVCPVGMVKSADTLGHCCYPGQGWAESASKCVGVPSACPTGLAVDVASESCAEVTCADGRVRTPSGNCCWPGQAWVSSSAKCVGSPTCPAGSVLVDGDCMVSKLDRTEVTVSAYRKCVNSGRCNAQDVDESYYGSDDYCNWPHPDRGEHPMNCVDWSQADAYCRWAGGRLPTEQEWEQAATNGGTTTNPWGDDGPTCRVAVMDEGGDGCGLDRTWPVCSKPAGNTKAGLCDLAGNVWEWTSTQTGSSRVGRGGSWRSGASNVGASARDVFAPSRRFLYLGFRCLRD
jgi:sulfatase modifying factor 1